MTEEGSNIDYELITKYLAGETTAEEHKAVSLWLIASEDNRHVFAQLKTTWEQSGRIIPREDANVDVDKGWQQFKERIRPGNHASERPKQTKSRSLFYYFSRVAALLVIGITIYLIYQSRQEPSVVEKIQLAASDEFITDTLPDGSLISLNTHSQLSFPQKFSSGQRLVSLQGEAFFQVAPNPQRPFIVKVKDVEIKVLGTSFLIQAYDSLDLITVGVQEGKVKVATSESSITLETGERISFDRATRELSPIGAYDDNQLYWKSKTLIFQRKELAEVFRTLEETYNISITAENDSILDCRLTAKFYGESIHRIFEIINTNFDLTTKNEGNRFIISGHGCN